MKEVDVLCSRVIIIDKGRLVVDATPDSLAPMSEFHNSICLEVSNVHPEDVEASLLGINTLSAIQYDERENSFRLLFQREASRSSIEFGSLAEIQGWKIRTLVEERGDLERVFLELTTAD